jgi:hypothetical protein
MSSALEFERLMRITGGRMAVHDVACPLCGPEKRSPANRVRKVLRVWYVSPGFASYVCARCGVYGWSADRDTRKLDSVTHSRVAAELEERKQAAAAERLKKALWLWDQRRPVRGSAAENYLRRRAYTGRIPPTLGFLPARAEYPPAMIAAFGFPIEREPYTLSLATEQVTGVHVTRLLPDGSDRIRADKAKIMIGFSTGTPIALSPPTDGQALVITEGIEDALSAYEATGLCAWAAGSASRLPALADAVPGWVEAVTILADDDADGRRHAGALADKLRQRGIEIRFIVLGEHAGPVA